MSVPRSSPERHSKNGAGGIPSRYLTTLSGSRVHERIHARTEQHTSQRNRSCCLPDCRTNGELVAAIPEGGRFSPII